ncbi:6538_t:CDS:2, partial [Scutellospora calospora]
RKQYSQEEIFTLWDIQYKNNKNQNGEEFTFELFEQLLKHLIDKSNLKICMDSLDSSGMPTNIANSKLVHLEVLSNFIEVVCHPASQKVISSKVMPIGNCKEVVCLGDAVSKDDENEKALREGMDNKDVKKWKMKKTDTNSGVNGDNEREDESKSDTVKKQKTKKDESSETSKEGNKKKDMKK